MYRNPYDLEISLSCGDFHWGYSIRRENGGIFDLMSQDEIWTESQDAAESVVDMLRMVMEEAQEHLKGNSELATDGDKLNHDLIGKISGALRFRSDLFTSEFKSS